MPQRTSPVDGGGLVGPSGCLQPAPDLAAPSDSPECRAGCPAPTLARATKPGL